MNENTRSFAECIIGQREQGRLSEKVSHTHGLTQAQRQAVEKLKADSIQYGTCKAFTVEHPLPSQDTLQPSHQSISRRTALLRLAGLVVGGVADSSPLLLACSKPPAASPLSVGTTLYTYQGHSNAVWWSVAWSPDGKRIASGGGNLSGGDPTVQVWDAIDGGHVYTYKGHSAPVYAVTWSPDGKRIASGSVDNTVQVWDATNGGNVFIYRGHSSYVIAVAWSPNGKYIVSGAEDAQVWDAITGNQITVYKGQINASSVAWSPDGKRIASGSGSTFGVNDHTVQVWDATDGGHVYTYRGHSDIVLSVAWSPDGKRIASGSRDKTVQVWDAATGDHIYTYHGHSNSPYGYVKSVAWSPDGKRIASGSWDSTVQVWVAG